MRLVFVGAAALVVGGAYWLFSGDPQTSGTGAAAPASLSTPTAAAPVTLSAEPPASTLAWRLKSVNVSPMATNSSALIDDGAGARHVVVGSEVNPGVQLAEVREDRVFILRGNQREVLMLESAPAAASLGAGTKTSWGTLASYGGGVVVQTAAQSGVGFDMDLLKGDAILRVNGMPVSSAAEIEALWRALPVGGTIHLEGMRNNKPMALVLERTAAH